MGPPVVSVVGYCCTVAISTSAAEGATSGQACFQLMSSSVYKAIRIRPGWEKKMATHASPYFTRSALKRKRAHVRIAFDTSVQSQQQFCSSTTGPHAPKSSKVTAPEHWEVTWQAISKMRESQTAPVDTMGCERLGDHTEEPKVHRFQTLVSLMLSSQTKDQVTAAAMARLKRHGLSVESILSTKE